MNIAIFFLSLVFSMNAFSKKSTDIFSKKNSIQIQKIVLEREILLPNLLRLHNDFEVDEMIAKKELLKSQKESTISSL